MEYEKLQQAKVLEAKISNLEGCLRTLPSDSCEVYNLDFYEGGAMKISNSELTKSQVDNIRYIDNGDKLIQEFISSLKEKIEESLSEAKEALAAL
jgi:hypothetical protein